MSVRVGDRTYVMNASLSSLGGRLFRTTPNDDSVDFTDLPPASSVPNRYNDVRPPQGLPGATVRERVQQTLDNPRLTLPVQQTTCGQCYIVSTVQHIHDLLVEMSGAQGAPRLSHLYVLCHLTNGCGGGSPMDVNEWVAVHGVVEDDLDGETARGGISTFSLDYYDQEMLDERFGKNVRQAGKLDDEELARLRERFRAYIKAHPDVRFYRTTKRVRVFSDDGSRSMASVELKNMDMKRVILKYGSVIIAMPIRKDFMKYWQPGTGRRPYVTDVTSPMVGGHAVTAVGWVDDDASGEMPHWIFRNSWGYDQSPEGNGFGRLAMFFPGGRGGFPEVNREMWLGYQGNGLGGTMSVYPAIQRVTAKDVVMPWAVKSVFGDDVANASGGALDSIITVRELEAARAEWPPGAIAAAASLGAALVAVAAAAALRERHWRAAAKERR